MWSKKSPHEPHLLEKITLNLFFQFRAHVHWQQSERSIIEERHKRCPLHPVDEGICSFEIAWKLISQTNLVCRKWQRGLDAGGAVQMAWVSAPSGREARRFNPAGSGSRWRSQYAPRPWGFERSCSKSGQILGSFIYTVQTYFILSNHTWSLSGTGTGLPALFGVSRPSRLQVACVCLHLELVQWSAQYEMFSHELDTDAKQTLLFHLWIYVGFIAPLSQIVLNSACSCCFSFTTGNMRHFVLQKSLDVSSQIERKQLQYPLHEPRSQLAPELWQVASARLVCSLLVPPLEHQVQRVQLPKVLKVVSLSQQYRGTSFPELTQPGITNVVECKNLEYQQLHSPELWLRAHEHEKICVSRVLVSHLALLQKNHPGEQQPWANQTKSASEFPNLRVSPAAQKPHWTCTRAYLWERGHQMFQCDQKNFKRNLAWPVPLFQAHSDWNQCFCLIRTNFYAKVESESSTTRCGSSANVLVLHFLDFSTLCSTTWCLHADSTAMKCQVSTQHVPQPACFVLWDMSSWNDKPISVFKNRFVLMTPIPICLCERHDRWSCSVSRTWNWKANVSSTPQLFGQQTWTGPERSRSELYAADTMFLCQAAKYLLVNWRLNGGSCFASPSSRYLVMTWELSCWFHTQRYWSLRTWREGGRWQVCRQASGVYAILCFGLTEKKWWYGILQAVCELRNNNITMIMHALGEKLTLTLHPTIRSCVCFNTGRVLEVQNNICFFLQSQNLWVAGHAQVDPTRTQTAICTRWETFLF